MAQARRNPSPDRHYQPCAADAAAFLEDHKGRNAGLAKLDGHAKPAHARTENCDPECFRRCLSAFNAGLLCRK